jgi:hypothetical protein
MVKEADWGVNENFAGFSEGGGRVSPAEEGGKTKKRRPFGRRFWL